MFSEKHMRIRRKVWCSNGVFSQKTYIIYVNMTLEDDLKVETVGVVETVERVKHA